uniref:F-box associated domain-containing protein n=1 Tax=Oryza barthii TaxID=65489 RepID=A0A0D3F0T1_9ORYZ
MGSLRRVVHMVTALNGSANLRHIDTSRFFSRRPPPPFSPSSMAVVTEESSLPEPSMSFYPAPAPPESNGDIGVMLFGRARDRLLVTDQSVSAAIYDAATHALLAETTPLKPKYWPVSVPVGDDIYLFDLPKPIESYTVVGGSEVWISTARAGTYAFDTVSCSWSKQADWPMPFAGLAEYVPEHKLWFGLSSSRRDKHPLCAVDLAAAVASPEMGPELTNVWMELSVPREWIPVEAFLVHLGSSRFFVARFFQELVEVRCDFSQRFDRFAVFTGVELERTSRGELRMIKHKSERYSIAHKVLCHSVL